MDFQALQDKIIREWETETAGVHAEVAACRHVASPVDAIGSWTQSFSNESDSGHHAACQSKSTNLYRLNLPTMASFFIAKMLRDEAQVFGLFTLNLRHSACHVCHFCPLISLFYSCSKLLALFMAVSDRITTSGL